MAEILLKNPVGPFFSTRKIWVVFSLAVLLPLGVGIWSHGLEAVLLALSLLAASFSFHGILGALARKSWTFEGDLLFQSLLVISFLPGNTPWWVGVIAGILLVLFRALLGKPAWLHPVLAVWIIVFLSFSPGRAGGPEVDAGASVTPLTGVKTGLLDGVAKNQSPMEASGLVRSEWDQKGADWLNNQIFGLFNVNLPGGYLDLLFGRTGGSLGESSGFFILLASLALLAFRLIPWEIPLTLFLSHSLTIWIFGGLPFQGGFFSGDILFYTLSGSLLLGMFFIATDYSTVPLGAGGKIAYGCAAGILMAAVRLAAFQPEGTAYALVIMNFLLPFFQKLRKTPQGGKN